MSTIETDNKGAEASISVAQADSIESDANKNVKHFKYDKDLRRQRLANGPSAKDIFTIFCAGFALISDGYQNNVMSMLNKVFALKYPKVFNADMSTNVSNASLIATIFGQVVIGLTADYIGRKWSIITGSVFLVVGSAMCAASHGVTVEGMFWMLIISRGVTGFGIGAEYPSSSVSASEAANETVKRRGGAFILCTNLPLSFGGPFALIIFLIVNKICGPKHLEALWRTMFAIGCFWPLSVFYFRLKLATSELYKKNAIKKTTAPYWLALKYYWPRLLGTCLSWFLYDFVTFPNGIFSSGIISNVIKDKNDLEKIAEWNLLLGVLALPGVFVGAWLNDRIGRKYTIMIGFSGYIVFGLIVGIAYHKVKKITGLFIVLYGLMMSMGNLGPGDGMGLVSSESFATPIRGTCYGLSAAIGKVGAVVGTKSFTPIQKNLGNQWTFIIAAICGLAGVLVTLILIPHLNDDDLMEEDVKFKNYLIDNGWKGHFGTEEYDVEQDSDFTDVDSTKSEDIVEKPQTHKI
ncbi:putative plasma membrane permease, glycerophosphoinositol and glycerophosphocholine uptake [Suhomyces tanzawaensis NRRL Y-17324]|uniref:Putative plasma membrane permease, glycerophosphoinositol and glycerophosphocholine uptake n=1 Tax=Suhomyces tanzawaensis NRRL Y-17324 TaxID=984487 RepID=A0A1E4SRJ6_9ASCO|nr:putative plasma membrane permease, glycerophosphoinositol and glycerophosphocholine uptake [Suhomyces tanzawaensis NRRL Y-17324]ODV82124.1 putative plasma membrane permease, glycerophosphoinositol and glycerophosphocholine uptake [Suhomyces tanzawaensis NRRL Y-17324]